MGTSLIILCIALAVLGLFIGILGLFLNKKNWKFEKISGTIKYNEGDIEQEDNDTKNIKLLHKVTSIEKVKGIAGDFSFKYQIPEFYKKIKSGNKQAITHALILFGFFSCTLFTFLAIGIGLVNAGESGGWYILGIVIFVVIFLFFSHTKQYRKSKRKA